MKRLVWPYERPARSDLRSWARALCAHLDRAPTPFDANTQLNQAALVFSHLGVPDVARWVCTSQIEYARHLSQQDRNHLVLALQPTINLGRLALLAGQLEEAVVAFDLAVRMERQEERSLAGLVTVRALDWAIFTEQDPTLAAALANVHVVETAQALLIAGRGAQALSFCEQTVETLPQAPWRGIAEATVASCAQVGDMARGQQEAARVQGRDQHLDLAVSLHLADGYASSGDLPSAERLATGAGHVLATQDWAAYPTDRLPQHLPMLEAALDLTIRLGLDAQSRTLATTLLQVARRAHDQVATVRALRFLACDRPGGPDPQAAAELRQQEATCEYFVVRRASRTSPSSVSPDTLAACQDLVHAVRAATHASSCPDLGLAQPAP